MNYPPPRKPRKRLERLLFHRTIRYDEDLYRAVVPNGIQDGFIPDTTTGLPALTVEMFAKASGGGYSCCTASNFLKHGFSPKKVFMAHRVIPGPQLPARAGIISFSSTVLQSIKSIVTVRFFETKANREYAAKTNPQTNGTIFTQTHVVIMQKDGLPLDENEMFIIVSKINDAGFNFV